MSRILYIIRHAQAAIGLNQQDAERNLTSTGEQQANRVGKMLKSKDIFPDLILCSSAVRARKTAVIIATELGIDPATIKIHKTIYSDNVIEILKLINEVDSNVNKVMVVGHFPTIVELYNYINHTEQITSMDTAELRSLVFEMPWAEITENSGTQNILGI